MSERIVSVSPVVLPTAPNRGAELQVRVSAPTAGTDLPVVVFSHGYGSSMRGYGPLSDYWAIHGFVVVQPTHLDSRTLGLTPDDERWPRLLRFRVEDMITVLDHLDIVTSAVPDLPGRVDPTRIAAAGHSFGGQTTGVLLGARVVNLDNGTRWASPDPRVRAGVLLATAGTGGTDLTPWAAEQFPYMQPDFAEMTTPTLVVAGDADDSPLSTRGPDWSTDPYRLSPGARSLLTVFGGEHSLGGIPGYDAAETTDADPARLGAVQRVTTAFLRTALASDRDGWIRAAAEFTEERPALGTIDSK
ncbi:alpha/beta hydrolase family protein [Mycobacterium sp. BMJ-28]